MRFWGTHRKQATYSRLLAEVAANEAVRAAEEVVGAAWLDTLTEAEEQAAFATKVCTHMRETAHQLVRAAEASRDAGQVESGLRELAASQESLAKMREQQDCVQRFVGRQRTVWATAARTRALEALGDRERLVEAARWAGERVERRPVPVDERVDQREGEAGGR